MNNFFALNYSNNNLMLKKNKDKEMLKMRGDILKKKLMVLCAVAIMISTCLTGKMNSGKIRFGSAGISTTRFLVILFDNLYLI